MTRWKSRIALAAYGGDLAACDLLNRIDLRFDHLALAHRSGRHRNVEHYASGVVNRRVLLVTKLMPPIASRGRHARIRIGPAHLFRPAALSPCLLVRPRFPLSAVLPHHLAHMTLDQALPADIARTRVASMCTISAVATTAQARDAYRRVFWLSPRSCRTKAPWSGPSLRGFSPQRPLCLCPTDVRIAASSARRWRARGGARRQVRARHL